MYNTTIETRPSLKTQASELCRALRGCWDFYPNGDVIEVLLLRRKETWKLETTPTKSKGVHLGDDSWLGLHVTCSSKQFICW